MERSQRTPICQNEEQTLHLRIVIREIVRSLSKVEQKIYVCVQYVRCALVSKTDPDPGSTNTEVEFFLCIIYFSKWGIGSKTCLGR